MSASDLAPYLYTVLSSWIGHDILTRFADGRRWDVSLQLHMRAVETSPAFAIRLGRYLTQMVPSRLETSYAEAATVQRSVGHERLRRLWQVEPEFIDFLLEYGGSAEYRGLRDGEGLARRFEAAGFGALFYGPDRVEREELGRSKRPDLDSPLTRRLALDTLYSLLADADFEKEQAAIDTSLASERAAAA